MTPLAWRGVPKHLLEHRKWKPTAVKGITDPDEVFDVDSVLPFLGTKDEDNALLQGWGSGMFGEINAAHPTADAKKVGDRFVALIESLPEHPDPPEIYRALGFYTKQQEQDFLASLGKPGSVYKQTRPITAWTAENPLAPGATPANNIALDLAASFGDNTVILTVKKPKATRDISYLYGSTKPGGELVYTRGTELVVDSIVKRPDGKTVVTMKHVEKTAVVPPPTPKPLPTPVPQPKPATTTPAVAPRIGMPGKGATRRVWELGDELHAQLGRVPTRGEIIAAGQKEGLNAATISTQYAKWKNAPLDSAAPTKTAVAPKPVTPVTVTKDLTKRNLTGLTTAEKEEAWKLLDKQIENALTGGITRTVAQIEKEMEAVRAKYPEYGDDRRQ